jgi:hypothetical protein
MRISLKSALPLAVAALVFVQGAWAQGCVLCYTSLANSGPAALRAFEIAMIALLVPALLLFIGVFFIVFRGAWPKSARIAFAPRRYFARLLSQHIKPVESRA